MILDALIQIAVGFLVWFVSLLPTVAVSDFVSAMVSGWSGMQVWFGVASLLIPVPLVLEGLGVMFALTFGILGFRFAVWAYSMLPVLGH